MLPPPGTWPDATRRVYADLQTYRIVGASACVAAIAQALSALADDLAHRADGSMHQELADAAALFCALKPNTAAYANVVQVLLQGLEGMSATPAELAAIVARRVDALSLHRRLGLERIAGEACALLPAGGAVLIHDYSSTVMAVLAEASLRGNDLSVFVTTGQPVDQGPRVAQSAASHHHHVTYLPDTAIGRVMAGIDAVLSGVETLFQNGDCANTVGTYPLALVAQDAGVPFYGVTECLKIHPTATTVTVSALTAEVLHGWPAPGIDLPPGTRALRAVLDLTPARLVTGYVTEYGLVPPGAVAIALGQLASHMART